MFITSIPVLFLFICFVYWVLVVVITYKKVFIYFMIYLIPHFLFLFLFLFLSLKRGGGLLCHSFTKLFIAYEIENTSYNRARLPLPLPLPLPGPLLLSGIASITSCSPPLSLSLLYFNLFACLPLCVFMGYNDRFPNMQICPCSCPHRMKANTTSAIPLFLSSPLPLFPSVLFKFLFNLKDQ